MQFNYYFLKHLTPVLKSSLQGRRIAAIFSQNKDELVICFENDQTFIIKANLDHESSLLSFPGQFARARKNSVDLFEEIYDLQVKDVRQFENERSFSIILDNGFELLFKLHGRHSNIILFKNASFHSLFKQSIDKDKLISLDSLDRSIDQSDENLRSTSFDLRTLYPTFDKHVKNQLKALGFYESQNPTEKLEILHSLLTELNKGVSYVAEVNGMPQLFLFEPESYIQAFEDPIEASNSFARQFFSSQGLASIKGKLLAQVNKEIKKTESYVRHTKAKLAELKSRRGYEELANILMANLHQTIESGAKQVELHDFYINEPITIKLKSGLSLQKNAELMYRKAKNQSKEVQILAENIQTKQDLLVSLQKDHKRLTDTQDIKLLRSLGSAYEKGKDHKESLPFITYAIDGFSIYMGKNARNNDLLTQKFAKKNDLWLHARDVSGSHVIIRNPNDVKIPMSVIEKAAQVAAWHSKRKSDTLCPVIYTQKKYVRKPKGSLPGQVVLAQEQVILVKPERFQV